MQTPMRRYFINQPSTLQPAHSMHGQRVIAPAPNKENDSTVTVYFVSGPVISAYIDRLALSPGWPDSSK